MSHYVTLAEYDGRVLVKNPEHAFEAEQLWACLGCVLAQGLSKLEQIPKPFACPHSLFRRAFYDHFIGHLLLRLLESFDMTDMARA